MTGTSDGPEPETEPHWGGLPGPRPADVDATVLLTPYRDDSTVVIPAIGDGPTTAEQPTLIIPRTPADPSAAGSTDVATQSVAKNSAMMAMFSLVSRATGFLRTAAIAAVIGGLAVAGDYNLANTVPNMVYELLLGGVLAGVVVPLLVRARTRDTDRGEAYTHRLLTLATVFLATATVVAVIAAPLLAKLFVNNLTTADDQHLVTVFGYLLLPEILFYGVAALLAAVLNTRGHFAAPTWTPILNNLVVIATAVLFVLLPTAGELTAGTITNTQILVLGVGTTLGIVIQALGLWPALRKVGFRWRWRFDFRALGLGELGRVGSWMLLYVVVSQIGVIGVLNIAQRAFDRGGAGPAIYLNGFLIFMMAHGIVAVSIITALMPRMSQAAAEHRHSDLAGQLAFATRLSAVVLIPATALYLVLGQPLAIVLFQRGQYKHSEALDTGNVIAFAGLALLPFAISQLQIFAFYAMPDTKTPALINIPSVAVRLGVDILILVTLSAGAVAAGLMFGNAVSFVLASALGYWLLRRRIGPLGLAAVGRSLIKLAIAALVAAAPAWLVTTAIWGTMDHTWTTALIQVAAGGLVLGLVYLIAARVLRAREVTELFRMLRGRLAR